MRGDLSPEAIWKFCTGEFGHLMQQRVEFTSKLDAESNLWPDLLIRNSESVGLACPAAAASSAKLKALVHRRNEIAHGQKMVVKSLREYQEYEDATLVVMHELAVAVIESIESRSYLAHIPSELELGASAPIQ